MLEVYLPYPKGVITQRFGENGNISYKKNGLKGHTAYDWGVPWGTAIPNCVENAYCYSILNKNNPDPSQYCAVYFIVEPEDGTCYEISYGHCSKVIAQVGTTYQVGDIIGSVGNKGTVFVGNHEVTKAEKLAGSQAGSHLHGPQIRLLQKVRKYKKGYNYITDGSGTYQKDGYYYKIPDYKNGYNGCISLRQFSTEVLAEDYDVYHQQKIAENILPEVIKQTNTIQKLPVKEQEPPLRKLLDWIHTFFRK